MQREYVKQDGSPARDLSPFARQVWTATFIVTAVAGGIVLLAFAWRVFLLAFGAALFGIFLRAAADAVGRMTHLGRDGALGLMIALLLLAGGGIGWLLATPVSQQVSQLSQELPQAAQKLKSQVQQYSWGRLLVRKMENPGGLSSQMGSIIRNAGEVFSISVEGVVDVLVILFCGFYLAARPEVYMNGFLRLVPRGKRPRARQVVQQIHFELTHWLFGQIISMTIIGLLTWLGLFLLGIQASEVLGLLAGILDFVSVVGPFVAGVLSCGIALLKSPMHAFYVLCLFMALHLLEGHVLIPLVQRRATRLPPVLTILAMVLFYMLFGLLGLLLAVPLLAFVIITVRALYVEDVVER